MKKERGRRRTGRERGLYKALTSSNSYLEGKGQDEGSTKNVMASLRPEASHESEMSPLKVLIDM